VVVPAERAAEHRQHRGRHHRGCELQLAHGNIGCIVFDKADTVEARCDISQKRWQPPPKPADCPVDYGQGLALSDTAGIVCAGDTAPGATRQLAYGDALQVGRFVCTSRETGMTCENTRTRHGFELSQASYRFY